MNNIVKNLLGMKISEACVELLLCVKIIFEKFAKFHLH